MAQENFQITVALDFVGQRLDKFLSQALPHLSRTRIQDLLDQGLITIEGRPCQASRKVKVLEIYAVVIPEDVPLDVVPQDIPLDIVFEDDDLLVLNKPAGLVVHPAPGHHDMTLVNALLAHCGESLSGIGGVKRPGIVHRLDKDTSGLMVVAKNDQAHHALSAQFSDRTLSRRYEALVWGRLPKKQGEIEGNIGRSHQNRQKMTVLKTNGKPAKTLYDVLETFLLDGHVISHLSCKLTTGRTHQIRVHLSHLGHPLLGDPLYGKGGRKTPWPEAVTHFYRQALHAKDIEFIHPRTSERLSFSCPLPLDMQNLIEAIRDSCYPGPVNT